jgi:uncharacterized protein YhaN
MRLSRLELVRFGPFSDFPLDFGSEPGRLEIVYGPNEAGKSTALRAVGGLLYGIPDRTRDGHLFPMQELRLGGLLVARDGARLEIVRLKKRKNALLGADGQPLEERALVHFLGGVGRDLFERAYGLDAARLREGAEAILSGNGDVGEALFDAGIGGGGVGRLLTALGDECDALYSRSSRAEKPRINALLRQLDDAKGQVQNLITTPRAYAQEKKLLEELETELAGVEARRHALHLEQLELTLAVGAVPLLGQRARIVAELEKLGPVATLPSDARPRRESAERDLGQAKSALELLERRLTELEQERDALVVPEALLTLEPAAAKRLGRRMGIEDQAAEHLPRRKAELAAHQEQIRGLLRRLGRSPDSDPGEAVLDDALRARVEKLASERVGLAAQQAEVRARRDELGEKELALGSDLDRLPPAQDVLPLERALRAAERAGDLDRAEAEAAALASKLERSATRAQAALGLGGDPLERLLEQALPGIDTAEAWVQAERVVTTKLDRREESQRDAEQALERAECELDALGKSGAPPSPGELAAARSARDQVFAELRRAIGAGEAPELDRFETLGRAADELADRMFREAQRVARRAQLEAERELAGKALARSRERLTVLARERDDGLRELGQSFEALGVRHRSAVEALDWLRRLAALRDEVGALLDARAEAARVRALVAAHAEALVAALAPLDVSLAGERSHAARIERADAELAFARAREEQRTRAARELEEVRRARTKLTRREAELDRELSAWLGEWARAVAPLGLGPDALPEEAGAARDLALELGQKLERAAELERRIQGMERDARELADDIRVLAARHAPALAQLSPLEAAERLLELHQRAVRDRERREQLEREIETVRAERMSLLEVSTRAEAELAVLMRAAGVSDPSRLPECEARSNERARLELELRHVEQELAKVQEGKSLHQLELEFQSVDLRVAQVRREEVEMLREEMDESWASLRARVEGARSRLGSVGGDTRAVDGENEVRQIAASIRSEAERWARKKLAHAVLRRQIERYRERHEDPVLTLANRLFARLTGDHYLGLRPDVDTSERPAMRAIRADGQRVDVDGLSEGTRDQLYLALRLASLVHHAAHSEPLPLVLDDVLVQFDEERSRAALLVLAEVARDLQVLLFTHHAHLLEQARAALPRERLSVIELARRMPSPPLGAEALSRS